MKTTVSENEANRAITDAIPLALLKVPRNSQDELDMELSEHFIVKGIVKSGESRLRKIEDRLKERFDPDQQNKVELSTNYRRELERKEPRMTFDQDLFITKILAKYPNVLAHELRMMAADSKTPTAAPVSITLEYIGDITRD